MQGFSTLTCVVASNWHVALYLLLYLLSQMIYPRLMLIDATVKLSYFSL